MKKAKKTHKQRFIIFLKILLVLAIILAVLAGIAAIVNTVSVKSNREFIESLESVKYDNQLVPSKDEDDYYNFVTDEDFNVMQLTDVHIGGGFMSTKKDNMAINAVAAMISEEKPDLVVVTGDIAYPVPFQAGTFNNKSSAELFADLMEKLGVYWCPVFGNHDTEAYSFYTREDISKLYGDEKYEHCLFQSGPQDVDGSSNYPVLVKNSKGAITQVLYMFDSHSYIDGDFLGIMWKYDTIHKNQIDWYENTVNKFTEENGGVTPKSLCFYHIPNTEYRDAWTEYTQNGMKDTENVKFIYGKAGESGDVVYCGENNYGFFDKALELGSTQGIFCGHDHLNNFSLDYKGIRLTYGYSIDYLAYSKIANYGLQRGCTMISIKPDGAFESHLENYYQDKYVSVNDKETVDLQNDYNS